MKPLPPKARDLTIFGIVMGVCATAWLVLPEATFLAQAFVVCGSASVGYALYLWRRSGA